MELDLKDKVVLVTGSSKGIGFGVAKRLHAEGAQLVLNGRDQAQLAAANSELPGSVGVCADVSSPDEARKMLDFVEERFGRLDVLVCNVGSGRSVPPGEETFEEWQRVFNTNLWSTTNCVEGARGMLSKSGGSIVCISSICGVEVIPGAPVTYSVAKAALNAYVKGISRPLGREGIRINAIAPGNILFDGSVWQRKLAESEDAVNQMLDRDVSLAKLGTPEDVAGLVCYLASSQSGFATGSVWSLDGGQVRS